MKNSSLLLPFLFFLSITTLLSCSSTDEKTPPDTDKENIIHFTLLQMNDVYEISPLDGGRVAGLARVATVKKQLEAEGDSVIAILSGDFLSPSLIGTLKVDGKKVAGAHMVDVLNALGLDYATFGNHEFDIKMPELQERMDEAEFLFTTSNAFEMSDSGYAAPFVQGGYPVSNWLMKTIIHDKDTIMAGFVGVVLPFNERPWVHYMDVDSTFLVTVDEIQNDCAVVFGITHLLVEDDRKLAEKTKNVPLFMGGHDHSAMLEQVGDVRIAKADANAKSVYIHRVAYNVDTKETLINSELKQIDESIALDPKVATVVQKWNDLADSVLRDQGFDPFEVVATLTEPLDGTESFVRYNPAPIGQVICRAMMSTNPEVQIGILNSGSIRIDDVLTGTITQNDVLRTLPFGGGIAYAEINGGQLMQILETGTVTNHGSGGYLQIQGAEKKGENWFIGDEKIESRSYYKIVAPEFLMSGNESNLSIFKDFKAEQPAFVGDNIRNDIRDVMIAYLKDGGR